MNASRRRPRFRLSLLAIVALLWSQLAFAAHPGCVEALDAMLTTASVVETATPTCEHDAASEQDPVCHAHCNQDETSSDVARVPPVPPLVGLPPVPGLVLTVPLAAGLDPSSFARPPANSWRRPTAHPAEILQI